MKKLYIMNWLIIFSFCFLASCANYKTYQNFGGGFNVPQKANTSHYLESLSVANTKSDEVILSINTDSTICPSLSFRNIHPLNAEKCIRNSKKLTPSKIVSQKHVQKIQKAVTNIIPPKNSHWLKWVLFALFGLCALLGIIFFLYSFNTMIDSFESSASLAAGIILLLLSLMYKIVLKNFDNLSKKGIIFKIGMWTTLFGWFTFFSLAVSIPLWIIGAIFDI